MRYCLILLALLTASACTPQIGDDCGTSIDCDVNGTRVCDVSQPGGYCTRAGCETGTCPEDGVCIEFRPMPDRLSSTWCMAPCEEDGDCRDTEGYVCRRASDLAAGVAQSLDGEGIRFCTVQVD